MTIWRYLIAGAINSFHQVNPTALFGLLEKRNDFVHGHGKTDVLGILHHSHVDAQEFPIKI